MKFKHLPNYITLTRIAGTLWLIFIEPLSVLFYVVYSLCGLTDVVDGYLARKTSSTSELGARLDSVADLLFYAVMLFRVFPILWKKLPRWIKWRTIGICNWSAIITS